MNPMYQSHLYEVTFYGWNKDLNLNLNYAYYAQGVTVLKMCLKDLFNANACWLVLIYDTLVITYVAKRISKYVSYIL